MEKLAELLTEMTLNLVDHPNIVSVKILPSVADGEHTRFEVHVAPGDLGQAIGKEGRLANAMRILIKSAAQKHNLGRVLVEFKEAKT